MSRVLLLLLITTCVYSQGKSFFIYDKLNNEPIPFVNVKMFKNKTLLKGVYTNSIGKVNIRDLNSIDSLFFSTYGYESYNLDLKSSYKDTIYLVKEIVQLNEVVLMSKKKSVYKEVGYHFEKKKSTYSTVSGLETIVYIENLNKEVSVIKSVLTKILRRKNHTSVIKINFYETVEDSIYPSQVSLASSDYIYIEGNSKKIYEFDLEYLNLEMSEKGIFVGIEWIGIYDKENNVFLEDETFDTIIELNDVIDKPLTFSRNIFKNSEWFNLSENLLKYSSMETKNFPNISLGLKVSKLY